MLKLFTAITVWLASMASLLPQVSAKDPGVQVDLRYTGREIGGYTLPYHSSENTALGGGVTVRNYLYGVGVEGGLYATRGTKPAMQLFKPPQTRHHTMFFLGAEKQYSKFIFSVRHTRMHTNMPEGWFFQGDAHETTIRADLAGSKWQPYALISAVSSSYLLIDKVVLAYGAGVTTTIPVQEYGQVTVDAFAARSLFALLWGKESVGKVRAAFAVNHKILPVSLVLGCNILQRNRDAALWFDIVTSRSF